MLTSPLHRWDLTWGPCCPSCHERGSAPWDPSIGPCNFGVKPHVFHFPLRKKKASPVRDSTGLQRPIVWPAAPSLWASPQSHLPDAVRASPPGNRCSLLQPGFLVTSTDMAFSEKTAKWIPWAMGHRFLVWALSYTSTTDVAGLISFLQEGIQARERGAQAQRNWGKRGRVVLIP